MHDEAFLTDMLPAYHTDDFKNDVFPDAHNGTARRAGNMVVFTRGDPLGSARFVTHGTPLSIAYDILREGIRVGCGKHAKNAKPMHGFFCMDGGSARNRIANARDRSTSNRCLEFQVYNWPTGWTVPCVLAWEPWSDTNVSHLTQFADGCWKSCIPSDIGTQRHMPYNMSLIINAQELRFYTVLQDIQLEAQYMICGGKTWWDAHGTEQCDPIYWASDNNNTPPSCGRCIFVSALPTSAWTKTKGSKVWFCPSCIDYRCSPNYF